VLIIYFIPRNFSDSGRIMGMFEGRHAIQAGIWGVPLSFLIFSIPILALQFKAVLWGGIVGCPCMVILSGMLDKLLQRRRFTVEAKLYHSEAERRR